MLTVENVTIAWQEKKILKNVSCVFTPGHITTLLGTSGAGKTTLLKACAQLIPILEGSIMIDGIDIEQLTATRRAELIGYVFQEFHLFPHLTVLQNCIDPQLVHNTKANTAQERAEQILTDLGMNQFFTAYPNQLSGGQQQRVAIARALCLQPRVLLLDEPSASLDPKNSRQLATMLQNFAAQGLTIVLSSQDMDFARTVFDRVYYIEHGIIAELCQDITSINQCPRIKRYLQPQQS